MGQRRTARTGKPPLFIGSSTEGLPVAHAIKRGLTAVADVTLWNSREVFPPGQFTLEALLAALERFRFAVLVLSKDDQARVRGKRGWLPRDNVLLELGFFLSHYGRHRAFVVVEEGCKLPSDLAGLVVATYVGGKDSKSTHKASRERQAAVEKAVQDIVAAMKEASATRTAEEELEWAVRRDSELDSNDQLLVRAHEATFVAMTFKTLAAALSGIGRRDGHSLRLPHLHTVYVYVYALPVLRRAHPILAQAEKVANEWETGVRRTIEGLMDRTCCPRLARADLVVVSVPPTFTASQLRYREGAREETRIRFTPVVSGMEPKDVPTLHLVSSRHAPSDLFKRFRQVIQTLRTERAPLHFPLKRDGWSRGMMINFLARLGEVCSNGTFKTNDRLFNVHLHAPERELGQAYETAGCHIVADLYQKLGGRFRAELNIRTGDVDLWVGRKGANVASSRPVGQKHLVASFVLLTSTDAQGVPHVLLIKWERANWSHDVPGGKVTIEDRSLQAAAEREVFEELGLVLDMGKGAQPVAWKYDPQSAQEKAAPVVAYYFHHQMTSAQREEMSVVGQSTRQHALVWKPLQELIEDQQREADSAGRMHICHAPLLAFQEIQRRVRPATGRTQLPGGSSARVTRET